MRNGNVDIDAYQELKRSSFYPTYEEWKLICFDVL